MDRISKLFDDLDQELPIDLVRDEVIDLTYSFINDFGKDIDPWEKACITRAISALSRNISLLNSVSDIGLRLCLFNLASSLTRPELRSQDYPAKEDPLINITSEDLHHSINIIIGK